MYLIWMAEEQETQLPFLPSVENLEALSSFMTGRSSRSNSMEEHDRPRLSSHDCIASFPRSYDDIDLHFDDNEEQQHKHPKHSPSSRPPAGAALLPLAAPREAGSGSGDSQTDANSEQLSCLCCQRRKSKCDRGQPCSNCVTYGLECSYSKAKKRGPKPGSMLRIKEEAHHLKQTLKVLLQTLIDVNSDFEELGPSISELLEDSHMFDAGSCQIVIKGLTGCLSRSRQRQQESESKTVTLEYIADS